MSAEQRSAEWLYERVGYCTASRFGDVLAKLKSGKSSEKRQAYLMELVVERITGQPTDHYASVAMQWGEEQEMRSRWAYEAATGAIVEEAGFIKHPSVKWVGGSPDGLLGEDGGWESKSPYNSAHHIYTLLEGVPEEHIPQIQGLMWITGRKWWDFQSFDPRLPKPLDRYVKRVPRDEQYITHLATEVAAFTHEVEAMVLQLTERMGNAADSRAAA